MEAHEYYKKETGRLYYKEAALELELTDDYINWLEQNVVKLFAIPAVVWQNVSDRFLSEPISHAALVLLGYSHNPTCDYYCPPAPAHGGTYRLELQATQFVGGEPVKGTEEWRAYLTDENLCTIRRFKTLEELNYFHKGMCGEWLF